MPPPVPPVPPTPPPAVLPPAVPSPPTRRRVEQLLADAGAHPRRSLGQNFVVDPNTVRRIARLAAVGPGDRVVEIGAGLGSLTLALAATGAAVTAVEVDPTLVRLLRSQVEGAGVHVVEGDARRLDWGAVLGIRSDVEPAIAGSTSRQIGETGGETGRETGGETGGAGWTLVANLPYNVATPIVVELLEGVEAIGRMLVMVQREVGERLAARAGDAAYGAVSVRVAYWARAKLAGRVPPTVFVPQPRVESALVAIERRDRPAVDPAEVPREWLFTLVRAGFATRRKMLRRSLAGLVEPSAFAAAGIAPTARAEELDVETWGRLAACAGSKPPPS